MSRLFLATLILLACSAPALADHASIGTAPNISGPVITASAGTLAKGKISLGFTSEFLKAKAFSDAELIDKASHHVHAHSADYMLTNSLSAAYGLTDDLMLSARIPYIYRENIRAGSHSHSGGVTSNTAEDFGDSGGVGDILLMGKYRFLKNAGFESSVLFGLELPTGQTDKKGQGERLETEHQPGSGSWDPTLGLAASKSWNGFSFDASILYANAGKGSEDIDLGDRVNYGLALSKRLGGEAHDHGKGEIHKHRALDLVLELNGEWYGKQKDNGVKDNNSGGTQFFLSPGLRYTAGDNWSGQLSVGVPIRNDLRQGHADSDYRITVGIGKAF